MRTPEDLLRMMNEDQDINLNYGHYKPYADLINERGYKKGIEIGTAYGGLANHLLCNCDLKLLITIDPYKYYPDMPGLFDQDDYDRLRIQTASRLSKFPQCRMHRVTSEQFYSINAVKGIDFVFIDGLHTYEMVKWECEHYQTLIREGGILSGHDYNVFEGVNKAVDEFADSVNKQVYTLPGNIWYLNY